jgi:hypothetical protein
MNTPATRSAERAQIRSERAGERAQIKAENAPGRGETFRQSMPVQGAVKGSKAVVGDNKSVMIMMVIAFLIVAIAKFRTGKPIDLIRAFFGGFVVLIVLSLVAKANAKIANLFAAMILTVVVLDFWQDATFGLFGAATGGTDTKKGGTQTKKGDSAKTDPYAEPPGVGPGGVFKPGFPGSLLHVGEVPGVSPYKLVPDVKPGLNNPFSGNWTNYPSDALGWVQSSVVDGVETAGSTIATPFEKAGSFFRGLFK